MWTVAKIDFLLRGEMIMDNCDYGHDVMSDESIFSDILASKGFTEDKIEWLKSIGTVIYRRPFTMCAPSCQGEIMNYSDAYLLETPLDKLKEYYRMG